VAASATPPPKGPDRNSIKDRPLDRGFDRNVSGRTQENSS